MDFLKQFVISGLIAGFWILVIGGLAAFIIGLCLLAFTLGGPVCMVIFVIWAMITIMILIDRL